LDISEINEPPHPCLPAGRKGYVPVKPAIDSKENLLFQFAFKTATFRKGQVWADEPISAHGRQELGATTGTNGDPPPYCIPPLF